MKKTKFLIFIVNLTIMFDINASAHNFFIADDFDPTITDLVLRDLQDNSSPWILKPDPHNAFQLLHSFIDQLSTKNKDDFNKIHIFHPKKEITIKTTILGIALIMGGEQSCEKLLTKAMRIMTDQEYYNYLQDSYKSCAHFAQEANIELLQEAFDIMQSKLALTKQQTPPETYYHHAHQHNATNTPEKSKVYKHSSCDTILTYAAPE